MYVWHYVQLESKSLQISEIKRIITKMHTVSSELTLPSNISSKITFITIAQVYSTWTLKIKFLLTTISHRLNKPLVSSNLVLGPWQIQYMRHTPFQWLNQAQTQAEQKTSECNVNTTGVSGAVPVHEGWRVNVVKGRAIDDIRVRENKKKQQNQEPTPGNTRPRCQQKVAMIKPTVNRSTHRTQSYRELKQLFIK